MGQMMQGSVIRWEKEYLGWQREELPAGRADGSGGIHGIHLCLLSLSWGFTCLVSVTQVTTLLTLNLTAKISQTPVGTKQALGYAGYPADLPCCFF